MPSTRSTTSTRSERRNARYERRRQEIVAAATEVFRRDGYSEGSIEEIANRVGLLKGSLYHYIESKEDLLFLVLSATYDEARTRIDDVRAMSDLQPLERLRAYIQAHILFNATHTTKLAAYYHDFELIGSQRQALVVEKRSQFGDYIAGFVEEAQAKGDVDVSVDPKIAAYLVLGAMNSVYAWYRTGGAIVPDQLADVGVHLVISGLEVRG